jgi:hypothetical protein
MGSSVKQTIRAGATSRVALACTTAILFLAGCGEDGALLPLEPGGASPGIQGRVSAGGKPVPARISAIGVAHRYDDPVFVCPTDSTGRYAMPLAPGRYVLSAYINSPYLSRPSYYYATGGPASSASEADTLTVREGYAGQQADFLFGSLRLRLHLPAALVDDAVILSLAPWHDGTSWDLGGLGSAWFQVASTLLDAEIRPIPPGTWAVRVSSAQLSERLWLPGTWNPEEAEAFTVPADSVVEREIFLDASVARLRGSVTGSWQTMDLERPSVAAFVNESTLVAEENAEADGSWAMELYSARRVRLQVAIERMTRWIGGRSWAEATEFALMPGEETVVPPEAESGLLVRLRSETGWTQRDLVFTLVDDAGGAIVQERSHLQSDLFPLPNFAPGAYRIHLRPKQPGREGWLPQWFDGAPDLGSATRVVLPGGGAVVSITMTLEPGGEIRGRLLGDPSDWSWVNRSIFVAPADADSVWGCTAPMENGHTFALRGLPDGSYKICVVRPGFHGPYCGDRFTPSENSDLAWHGGASWGSAAVLTIRDHAPVEGIEIDVSR